MTNISVRPDACRQESLEHLGKIYVDTSSILWTVRAGIFSPPCPPECFPARFCVTRIKYPAHCCRYSEERMYTRVFNQKL